ncbi:four-jointed box protein 1 [Holotrichia oblita]|uniref:Four-jointed box protein 1 n=1 Tax=Holotrichia oblita TaxID=644536 RepID=A0ACB9SHP9_HOLOL|nr:four-jointed box protein 1 [Holotrichia oblita]
MVNYSNFGDRKVLPIWYEDKTNKLKPVYRNLCLLSVVFAFSIGLFVGILIPLIYFGDQNQQENRTTTDIPVMLSPAAEAIKNIFVNNSYGYKNLTGKDSNINEYPTVSFIDKYLVENSLNPLLVDGVYWGKKVEDLLPIGYDQQTHISWSNYVDNNAAVKLEQGCGRMQNRLVTFQDGSKGCARYRQNIDQIQGELFSFYLAQILKLENLAPSVVSVVNLKSPLWENIAHDIASAQWNSNRPIVLTKFIANLDSANIPAIFKPNERHLNKNDVVNMTEISIDNGELLNNLVELAQWSDLIIFDYLTANLDRIVNNLFNYQWNINIMDAPAHNLAKNLDTNLLVFLDNESGLLHGYRLLQKYERYHSILLENLCVFRKQTADVIKRLKQDGNVGDLLKDMFEKRNSAKIKDVLPTLPDKSVKILNERIDRVHEQIMKCSSQFSDKVT